MAYLKAVRTAGAYGIEIQEVTATPGCSVYAAQTGEDGNVIPHCDFAHCVSRS